MFEALHLVGGRFWEEDPTEAFATILEGGLEDKIWTDDQQLEWQKLYAFWVNIAREETAKGHSMIAIAWEMGFQAILDVIQRFTSNSRRD